MESNQNASGDELTGTQKEAQLRALTQRTGYQLRQVCRFDLSATLGGIACFCFAVAMVTCQTFSDEC